MNPRLDGRAPAARLARLFAPGSIEPMHDSDDSGVATARGRLGDSNVVAFCTDPAVMGGALGAEGSDRIVAAIDEAVRSGSPVIGLWHSGGARLADGVESMDGVGRMFAAMTRASGRVPQISIILGPAAGAAAYGPALTDVTIMAPGGRMFVTGPDVVRKVTGEQIDMEALGGPATHSAKSGVAHLSVASEEEACTAARTVTALLTGKPVFDAAAVGDNGDLAALLPDNPRRAYDVRPLVRAILDEDGPFVELQPRWAPNMMIGLGRLAGGSVGVLANNPLRKGGCLDSLSAEKAARFVRMCDSLGVPLVVLTDVPGYLPGVTQEWDGVIRRGAKLLHAFAEATVPRVTLHTRQSYGGAYIAMNSRSLGATAVFAWPGTRIAVMSSEAAVGILRRKELAQAPEAERESLQLKLAAELERSTGGVDRARALGVVDEVIEVAHTRRKIAEALAAAPPARGRHGNIPL
ncbi:carboxyl transferase domain-containing protein [Nonomuraea sp. NPDC050404]|uniref:acyl-CoA carboxylase subunit beta n=1 Tax=Nonomuraea sp. NPDC050404 TaxID=3155783 RepID=UPI0034088CD8